MAGGRRRRAVAALVLLAITRVALRAHSDGLASYLRSPFDSAAHLSVKEQRPYDETCGHLRAPYNVSALTGSAQMSSQSGALSAVRQALTSGNLDNRKVVLVGDSVIYQIFSALVCLSRSAGGLVEEYGRSATVIGGLRILFNEWGGQLLTYNGRKQETMERNRDDFLSHLGEEAGHGHDWLKSCEDRETRSSRG